MCPPHGRRGLWSSAPTHVLVVSRDHVELEVLGQTAVHSQIGVQPPKNPPVVLVSNGQRAGVAFGLALAQQAQEVILVARNSAAERLGVTLM